MATSGENTEILAIGALIKAGRVVEAQAAVDGAIEGGRESDAMLALGGMLAAKAGDPKRAVPFLERLLARRPEDRATRLNLVQAWIALGEFDRIAALCAPVTGDPAADRLAAFAAERLGQFPRARQLYRAVLTIWRDDADSWANIGNVHDALGETDAAIGAFEQAITLRPRDGRFYLNLAGLLERADRDDARRRVLRDAASVQPDDPEIQLALGVAEAAMDDQVQAEAALRRAIALAPENPAAYLELGLILENHNRLDDLDRLVVAASAHLGAERALLEGWAAYRRNRFDEAASLADTLPETINPIRRFHLQALLADRAGDAPRAFALFGEMNRAALAAAPKPAPGPSYRDSVNAATAVLRAAASVSAAGAPVDDVPMPVFLVGFPRSGTTLLDTILGRLPNTRVLEEQPIIPAIERRIGAPDRIAQLDGAAIAAYRQTYLSGLRTVLSEFAGARIIDKHPLHMARMPLIDRLFPGAPILFIERHPFDVVLSCFIANFRLNHAMRSFTDLEEAARTYDAVLTAWSEARQRLALNVHVVRYERLVSAPETEMAAALRFLGASFDPAMLDTEAAARDRGHIRTASYSQVAEPIYQRSVARWRRYRDQLAPIAPILDRWVEGLGYDT